MTDKPKPLIVVSGHGTAMHVAKCPRMVVSQKSGGLRHCGARVRADREGRPVCAQNHYLTMAERLAAEAHFLDNLPLGLDRRPRSR